MKITKQARREARSIFRFCLDKDALNETKARLVIRQIAETKPRGYIGILEQFKKLIQLKLADRAAKIQTAAPITPEFQAQLQADLTRAYGAGLSFEFKQTPALLGGMRVQVGGDVYDGSVLARLTALRESF
jgi:F-type H+-transporting ATPase subunit delta